MAGQELVDPCDGLIEELSIPVILGHHQLGPHEVASYPQPLLHGHEEERGTCCTVNMILHPKSLHITIYVIFP